MYKITCIICFILTLLAGLDLCTERALAEDEDTVRVPDIVYSSPGLIVSPEKGVLFSADMDVKEQMAILISEIEKLKMITSRATVIITAELQLAEKRERDGAEITLTGGKIEKKISCTTNEIGQCVFILEPLSERDPDYKMEIKAKKYIAVDKKFRVFPGAIVLLPVRLELTQAELNRRIMPPLPPTQ